MRSIDCLNLYLLILFGVICQFNNLSTQGYIYKIVQREQQAGDAGAYITVTGSVTPKYVKNTAPQLSNASHG